MKAKSHGERTRERILHAGLKLWPDVSLSAVADMIGLTHPAIIYHFPHDSLKDAIAEYAVEIGHSRVVVQLIASNHKAIKTLKQADRLRHFNSV